MQTTVWSRSEIDTLKKLSGTESASTIGKKIGRTKNAVKNKIIQLNLPSFRQRRPVTSLPTKPPERPKERVTAFNYAGSPRRYSVRAIVGSIEWCPTCHAPVSNWQEHRERVGCKGKKK